MVVRHIFLRGSKFVLSGTPWSEVNNVKTMALPCHSVRLLCSEPDVKEKLTSDLVVQSETGGVLTLRMNNPSKLNAWTMEMMLELRRKLYAAETDDKIKVVILTGTDPYYCAGVNLSSLIRAMMPQTLHKMIEGNNRDLFDLYIEFKKPIIIAANGPMIGASVTSATLCDAIIASEKATFSTPFATLHLPPEGCSSVHFERLMGEANALRMLGPEGWKPTAAEALSAGLITEVVPHGELMKRAQSVAETWAKEGHQRWLIKEQAVDIYKQVNAKESRQLADAVLSAPFLRHQAKFLKSRNKWDLAIVFSILALTRPLWALSL